MALRNSGSTALNKIGLLSSLAIPSLAVLRSSLQEPALSEVRLISSCNCGANDKNVSIGVLSQWRTIAMNQTHQQIGQVQAWSIHHQTFRGFSSSAKPSSQQNVSWLYANPLWRKLVGIPVLAVNLLPAALAFLRGPSSFSRSVDRSKTEYPPIMEGLESKFVKANGIQLHVMATAPAPGKPLMLFLHGFPEFWYSWRHQLKHFSKDYQVAALDMRGYNLSDKPKGVSEYTIDKVATDVKDVVRALGHEKCVLVGHDWGGFIAWGVAGLYPEAVDKLIAMATTPVGQFLRKFIPAQAVLSYYMLLMTEYPGLYARFMAADDFKLVGDLLTAQVGVANFSQEDVERFKQALQRPGALQGAVSYYTALWSILAQHPNEPMNKRVLESVVHAPALMLAGDKEVYLRPELLEGLEDVAPNVQVQILDAAHFMALEKPKLVNTAMENWLKSQAGPGNK